MIDSSLLLFIVSQSLSLSPSVQFFLCRLRSIDCSRSVLRYAIAME